MASLTLAQIRKTLPVFFRARKCIYIKGSPGMGKTWTINDFVPSFSKQTGMRLGTVILNGGNLNLTDMLGYLVPITVDGEAHSTFTQPFWARTTEGKRLTEYDGGVIFIDEADKLELECKKGFGELALSGRCGMHQLPPGWVVWMAGNNAQDRSGSTKELDHLINRRFEIDVRLDPEAWIDWAVEHGVDPTLIAFAKQNPEIVFSGKVPEKQGPWCTPRSLVETGELLSHMATPDGKLPSDEVAVALASGGIGDAGAAQLFAFIRLAHELPDYYDIVKSPKTTKVPTKPDAQMLVCYQLAQRVTEQDIDPVVDYMERLPKEFSVTFAKSACKRTPALINTAAMSRWCVGNASLMSAISGV